MATPVKWDLIADPTRFNRGFREAERTSSRFGAGMLSLAKRLAGPLAIGAVAAAAVDVANKFQDANNTIRVGTGATGKALKGLEKDFRKTYGQVPSSAEDAATAIADLNTRTGQTGKGLQDLAKRVLNMSRITKTDLGGNIAATTRLFGDWGIKTKDQAGALDRLFRASQATGASVTTLAEQVVQFGSPLRQLGFNLDTTLALFGEFEKTGVNIQTVLPGLRFGLKTFAQAGKEPAVALAATIRKIKEAGSVAEANKLAFKTFGVRAGPDLAAAIREGHFDLDKLIAAIARGHDTIDQASRDTLTWRDKLEVLRHKLEDLAAPVLVNVFDTIATKLDEVVPKLRAMAKTIGDKLGPALHDMSGDASALSDDFKALSGSTAGVTGGFNLLDRGLEELKGGFHLVRQVTDFLTTSLLAAEVAALDLANGFLFVVQHTVGLFNKGIRNSAGRAREDIGAMRDDINHKLRTILSRKDIDVTARDHASAVINGIAYRLGRLHGVTIGIGAVARPGAPVAYQHGTDFVPKTQLALVHKGEIVIDPASSAMIRQDRGVYGRTSGITPASIINVHLNGPIYGDRQTLVRDIRAGIREAQRRSGVPTSQQLR